jgi:Rrf2 family protein
MARLLKMSDAASLALHAAGLLAGADGPVPTREIARRLKISAAHLSKVLQRLERAGYVKGARGPGGGFSLDRPADDVTLREICEAIEGPYEPARCPFHIAACEGTDALGEEFMDVENRLLEYLEATRLSDWYRSSSIARPKLAKPASSETRAGRSAGRRGGKRRA